MSLLDYLVQLSNALLQPSIVSPVREPFLILNIPPKSRNWIHKKGGIKLYCCSEWGGYSAESSLVWQINLCQDSVFSVCYECSVPLARVEWWLVLLLMCTMCIVKSHKPGKAECSGDISDTPLALRRPPFPPARCHDWWQPPLLSQTLSFWAVWFRLWSWTHLPALVWLCLVVRNTVAALGSVV